MDRASRFGHGESPPWLGEQRRHSSRHIAEPAGKKRTEPLGIPVGGGTHAVTDVEFTKTTFRSSPSGCRKRSRPRSSRLPAPSTSRSAARSGSRGMPAFLAKSFPVRRGSRRAAPGVADGEGVHHFGGWCCPRRPRRSHRFPGTAPIRRPVALRRRRLRSRGPRGGEVRLGWCGGASTSALSHAPLPEVGVENREDGPAHPEVPPFPPEGFGFILLCTSEPPRLHICDRGITLCV